MRLAAVLPALALVLVATTATSELKDARTAREGVSSLSFAPKPFHDNLPRMKVSLTTAARARRGFEYVVVLLVTGPETGSMFNCDNTVASTAPGSAVPHQHILGAPGRTYTLWLLAERGSGGHFCHGKATLTVSSVSMRGPLSKDSHILRTVSFRILRSD